MFGCFSSSLSALLCTASLRTIAESGGSDDHRRHSTIALGHGKFANHVLALQAVGA